MDILTGERPVKLEYRYLKAAADQEKKPATDEDLFPFQVEDACLVALTTACNARESDGGTTKKELLQFVEESFKLPEDQLKELKKKAQTSDKPELQVKCKVLHASGLPAKDANGLSDPFCRLGVISEAHFGKHSVKQKSLEHWKKEGLVQCVLSTKVKPATLEPEWNEDFCLSVADPSKELLVLEIWNSDKQAEKGASKGKGLKGLGTYIADKTIHRGDDFMGRFLYPLRSIPNAGEEKTFAIHSHAGKPQPGNVTLRLSIGAKKKKIPIETRLSEYTALTHALVNLSARKEGAYVRNWSGELQPMAKKLLEHHTSLNDVDALQQACIRLSVLVKYHKLYAVNMKAVWNLIRKLKEYHTEFSTLDQWKWQVMADLNDLSDEIQDVLKNHLSMFNISSPSDVAKIDEHVKSLCVVYSFQPFAKQLPPESASLKETLENCIKVAVGKWFRVLNAYLLPQVDKDVMHLAEFVSLSEHSLDLCQRTLKFLTPVFLEAGVDYFSPFYIALDKSLCREAESRMAKCGVSTETSSFAIYRSFVGIHKMMKYVNKSMCEGLSILNFRKWLFKDMVNDWIRVAITKCKDLIAKAIAADTWITVSKDVAFSSSALDATGFLLQVGTFWKHLEWPVASEAYGYAVSVMQGISGCALFYVSEVFKKISHDDMFDKKGQFRATEKVCIILNNMQHIRQELSQFEEKLELQSFCNWLEAEEKLGGSFKEMIKNVLASADEDVLKKMNQIMLEITDKLSPDIQGFLHSVIAKVGEAIDEKATDPLLEYLQHNLQTFVKYLSPAVLKTILQHVWRVSLDSMDKCLVKSSAKKGTSATLLHQRLFTALQTMRDFFHCEGDGLDDKELDSEKYKTLYSKLDILRLPTDKLNLRFFAELARCQREEVKKGKAELGTLLISVAYLKQSSVLEVDVIQGKSLPRLDKRSVIDPFVQLSLMPAWAFSEGSGKHAHFKTKVHKKTLDPFFNETFKLPAKQAEIDVEGTVLLLSVFSHEVVGANDFAGMCVVACKDIPQLVSSEALPSDSDAPQRKNLTLPLFRYTSETPAFAELDARVREGDEKASNFFKVNKMLLGHLLRLRHSLPGLPKGLSRN